MVVCKLWIKLLKNRLYSLNVLEPAITIAGLLYLVKMSSMFEICSEFAMISMGGAIERPLLRSIAPPIEIIVNSLADFKHWAYFYKV